jgi:hypothetical protein
MSYGCICGVDYVLLPFIFIGETYASEKSGTLQVAVRL